MPVPIETPLLSSRWDEAHAAALTDAERLLYRSNLLGADHRITNFGGGNTSAKLTETDPLTGEDVTVLWVKGSGGDLGSMKLDGFATLYLDKLASLKTLYGGPDREDEMVGLLPHCTFNLNPRAASIDTPLHGFLPYVHVDHVHPDAVIAIAASRNSRELTLEIFGETIGWLPWRRPGFELGLMLEKFARANPDAVGVVLESHGLFTWADDARQSYETTIATINKAIAWIAENSAGQPAFGGSAIDACTVLSKRTRCCKSPQLPVDGC
jgi:rhamnose utilization protein RhaD (predicted bifunctional aldolase and dehydrogenase)